MKIPPFNYILLKLASRCNLNCSYCYWFRDDEVYNKPALLSEEVEDIFLSKLEEHIKKFNLNKFSILFHGGEPMLIGKMRFFYFCQKIKNLELTTKCSLPLSMTTNGILIDEEWVAMFAYFNVSLTVSIDGYKEIHDTNRVDHQARPTYDKVIVSLRLLQKNNIDVGVLAVYSPNLSASEVFNNFVKVLNLSRFDILFPDVTHDDDSIPDIYFFYKELFDIWYREYANTNVEIRTMRSFLLGLLGYNTASEGLGYGPIKTLTMLTDGSLEPLDVLRIAGNGSTATNVNILTHDLQAVTENPIWLEAYNASLSLSQKCKECQYQMACGGGYLPHRWSEANRFNNSSAYCEDIKLIYNHIWNTISKDISIKSTYDSVTIDKLISWQD